jgi:hypothetical protein
VEVAGSLELGEVEKTSGTREQGLVGRQQEWRERVRFQRDAGPSAPIEVYRASAIGEVECDEAGRRVPAEEQRVYRPASVTAVR